MSRKNKLTLLTILTLSLIIFCAWSLKYLYYSGPNTTGENTLSKADKSKKINSMQVPKLFVYDSEAFKTPPPKTNSNDAQDLSENEMVQRLIALQRTNLQRCYENHLRNQPDSQGEVILELSISPYGKARKIRIEKNDFDDNLFLSCIQSVIKRIRFKTDSDSKFLISIPLQFN